MTTETTPNVTTPGPILWTDSFGDEHELLPVGTEVTYCGIEDHHSDLDNERAVITGHDLADSTPYEIRFMDVERMASPDHIWRPTTPTSPSAPERLPADDLANAVEAVLAGYGKSGQGARMAHLASALRAYRAVNR
jgi:hypothetical protein